MVSNDDIKDRLKLKREGTELAKENIRTEDLNDTTQNKSGIMGWWNKQGTGMKIGSIVGICCVGLLIIGLIMAMASPDQTSNATTSSASASDSGSNVTTSSSSTSSAANAPKTVTIAQLYGSSIPEGTYVKVTGTVVQSDGSNLRIENSDYKDILVEGSDLSAYEDQSVTVVGTYEGATSYETVMGSDRTVPLIDNAEIVKKS